MGRITIRWNRMLGLLAVCLMAGPRLLRASLVEQATSPQVPASLPHASGADPSARLVPSPRSTSGPKPTAASVTARTFPPPTELPPRLELPDPLVMLDGRRVTTREQWSNERRPELIALFQHYMYGFLPPAPEAVVGTLQGDARPTFGGKATLKEIAVTFGPPDGTLGYFLRPGGHSLKPEDWKAFLDFADKHLGSPARLRAEPASAGPASAEVDRPQDTGTAAVEVPRWEIHEFERHGPCRVENPFRDAALIGEFTSPSGKTHAVTGFHDGGDTWRLRFAPDEEGEWRYRLRGEGVDISQTGRLRCIAARGLGFLRIHPQNPYAFAHADGTPFFPMGDTCYGLYDDSHITPALRGEYLDTRRRQRFNFVRMSVGHSEPRAEADPTFWAWGGTPRAPDLDRLNPEFFRGLDGLFRDLQARGMNVELILLNFYRRPFTDTRLWTPARQQLWLRYVVARYAAFNNLFLWTLANEYETHPDGRYRLDLPADVDWAKAAARLVKQLDPYDHPVTVHPVISSSTRGVSPRDPIDSPWHIGGFFGEGDALDVLSQQTGQSGEGVIWDERLQCWQGDDPNLVPSLRADRRFRKPVLNTESGYEYLRGHPTERRQVHHTDKIRRSAWRIVCAGGYFAAGFHGTIGHSDIWNRIDAPNRYTFTVRDEGGAKQLGALYDFFSALTYWRMQPFEAVTGGAVVALADPGQLYLVYLPHGGDMTLDLSGAQGRLAARWFNPRDGRFGEMFSVTGGQRLALAAPDDQDWTLLVKR